MNRHLIPSKAHALVLFLAIAGLGPSYAQGVAAYEPTLESLSKVNPAPEWFRDAKVGIYCHWGVYSVPAFANEWYPYRMHRIGGKVNEHHKATWGDPNEFTYADFVPMFTAEKFDADEWAELFVQSGARFAGPVVEHHDGFAMWDSELTPWNAADMGPKRDITGELEKAIRKRDMKFVATFHHARNRLWQRDDGKWTGHYFAVKEHYPELVEDPQLAFLYGYMEPDAFYRMWKGKLVEVIDNYQPDLIWFDSWLDEVPEKTRFEFAAYYYNKAQEWGRDVVITRKQNDLPLDFSIVDWEKGRASILTENVWLTDDTISKGSWSYTEDLEIKKPDEVVDTLIDIVSKNGQLLLNVSPMADGTIPENQRKVLLAMGDWLRVNGEAIYNTRPWLAYGEGPTKMKKGGHFVGHIYYGNEDIRYTRSKDGKTLYATLLGQPEGPFTLSKVVAKDIGGGKVSLLGSQSAIQHKLSADGQLTIHPPKGDMPTPFAHSFDLTGFEFSLADEGTENVGQATKTNQPGPETLSDWNEALKNENLTPVERAEIHGKQANEALRRCRKYIDGWLAHADPVTGLIPRNITNSKHFWNGKDAAADNYAFMVLSSALTDRPLYNGRMLDMLRTETRLTSRVGALPADWDFNKQAFRHKEASLPRLIFGGSEYVKDGLMPLTEYLGHTPWSERMISIVDSILENATHATPGGKIPSDDGEVNGEMMQVLSRLCFMTGDERYLEMACRIADYYLLGDRHPTRDADVLKLRDHGCELISGLTEVYTACHFLRKEKKAAYKKPIHEMLDRILEVGINEHGLMYDAVNPRTGEVTRERISDNWGYNYNGFYTVYLLDEVERYREATRHALSNLKPHYWKFQWQGWGSDGIADSVEGAINLYNRERDVEGVAEWIDANLSRMLLIQKPDGVIEGWHGDGNYARTAIMWALMKQQGVTLQPWRSDVTLGAVRQGETLTLVIQAQKPWSGRVVFDSPRHRTIMQMPLDYPRINQFPEWFTVRDDRFYHISMDTDAPEKVGGKELRQGFEVSLKAGEKGVIKIDPVRP